MRNDASDIRGDTLSVVRVHARARTETHPVRSWIGVFIVVRLLRKVYVMKPLPARLRHRAVTIRIGSLAFRQSGSSVNEEALADAHDLMREAADELEGFRCFHCLFVFHDNKAAEHFGLKSSDSPKCLAELRAALIRVWGNIEDCEDCAARETEPCRVHADMSLLALINRNADLDGRIIHHKPALASPGVPREQETLEQLRRECAHAWAELEAVREVLNGKPISEFMESFEVPCKAADIRAALEAALRPVKPPEGAPTLQEHVCGLAAGHRGALASMIRPTADFYNGYVLALAAVLGVPVSELPRKKFADFDQPPEGAQRT